MATGTVKRLVVDKGFGFIAPEGNGDDGDCFFHRSALSNGQFESLTVGTRVQFELGESPKGPRAEHVSILQ